MKPLLSALTIILSLSAATVPALAIGVDMSSMTPDFTFPEPDTSGTVTQTDTGIDK